MSLKIMTKKIWLAKNEEGSHKVVSMERVYALLKPDCFEEVDMYAKKTKF